MTALENLLDYYNHLPETNTSKAVLRRCIANIHQLGELSIYELAELCYTSPATISRLVKALGYKSYSVFQTTLSEHCNHYDFHNRFSVEQLSGSDSPENIVLKCMAYNMEEFRQNVVPEVYMPIVDAIHNANSVTIFAYGIFFMENTLQSDLIMSGIPCDIISGDHNQLQQAKKLGPGDFAFFMFPDTIESAASIRATIEVCKQNGATIAILSSAGRKTFQHLAHYMISFSGKHYMADSFCVEMMLSALCIAYRKKYMDSPT